MEFRLLGSVDFGSAGRWVSVPRRQERCVLAVLLLEAGQPVPIDRLVEFVWPEHPPVTARETLRTYLSRVRSALTAVEPSCAVPAHSRGGYVLEVDRPAVDAHRFGALVDAAQAAAAPESRGDLLRQALALWRGPALADVGTEVRERLAARLEHLRVRALRLRIDADLDAGRDESLVSELAELVARSPLDEILAGQLMLALYRAGRRRESLTAFGVLRRAVRSELGLDPVPQLTALHTAILRDDPGLRLRRRGRSVPVPAQLPADVPGFAGRAAELAELDRLARDTDTATTVVISALSGTAGVGKTALAVRWAHRSAHRFPDGQLYVNLRGLDPAGRAATPAEVLRGFLEALGVPAQRIPPNVDGRAALYRSTLAAKRMLVLLDNARDTEQVRPLLPGAPGCLAVVTSRNQLTGLVATEGAHPLALDMLPVADARALLARRLGDDRTGAEPEAVDAIVDACARLPLALAIAAARARQTGFPLAAVAAELRDPARRLDALDAGDPASQVRAAFSWSYAALDPPAARMFRLFGLHPGPDVSVAAAASLAGHDPTVTRRLLAELTRAGLLTEHVPDRYTSHDLLRAYAGELATANDGAAV